MGRVPFYAFPNSPYSFYASPAEAYFHRQHPPFSPASSSSPRLSPTSRPIINVPVFDSAPSRPSSSPAPQRSPAAGSLVDLSFAATKIQSHFRGFCVRRHHPLLHLRTIARARKQLEDLQSELEIPEFSLMVRASEKERLRFSESIMAIILRLDAIEGSIAEVRSQRKEATKMAIKLQDALDAIMMQKDGIAALDPTADKGGMASSDDTALIGQPQEALHPEFDMVQGEASAVSANANVDVNKLQEKPLFSEDNVVGTCMPNIDNNNVRDIGAAEDVSLSHPCEAKNLAEQIEAGSGDVRDIGAAVDVSPLHPCEAKDLAEQREAGSGGVESVSQVQQAEAMCETEQDMALVKGEASDGSASHAETVATHSSEEEENGNEASGGNASHAEFVATHPGEAEVGNGNDALHVENHGNYMQNNILDINVGQDTSVDDKVDVDDSFAEGESNGGKYRCMHVVQEGINEAAESGSGAPIADKRCDYSLYGDAAHGNECPGLSTTLERLTDGNCSLDGHSSVELHQQGKEECSDELYDEEKSQARTLSMAETSSAPQDNAILLQLSEDCRQLKSLVGKLLVQNKAQSNIMCVLAERLKLLEHQQRQNCRHKQQKMLKKRKLKKGSKTSVKHHNGEEW